MATTYTCGTCDRTYNTLAEMTNCGCSVRVNPSKDGPKKSVREAHREHISKQVTSNWRNRKKK